MNELVLITRPGGQDQDERLLALAEWMGVPARKLTLDAQPALDRLVEEAGGQRFTAAISAEALGALREASPARALQEFIESRCATLLVYCASNSRPAAGLFDWLTDGVVSGLSPPEKRRQFHAPEGGKRFSHAFAGQSFTLKRDVSVPAFELPQADNRNVEAILLADERPLLLRTERGACELLLLAVAELPDIGEPLSEESGVEERFDSLIPFLIFLRHAFGEACWHGAPGTARLIIDDPLLNTTYGFLDYDALGSSMRAAGYGTSIAFIPWNHWRTSKGKAAKLFQGNPNLSICVHGCDHSNREFSETDPAALQWRADTALRRMERHQQRTAVAFDPVMVFPQGKFSSSAALALRSSDYLAAVNTTGVPTDNAAERPTIADYLRPAITKFHGFPIFQRRYPRRLVDFAFDIFLGRPALIVQHHQDFRDGYRRLETFVQGLHRIEPHLTWGPLAHGLMQSCMMRSLSERVLEVRFFTRRFLFRSMPPAGVSLHFTKEEPDASSVMGVLVDGRNVPFSIESGLLAFEHRADARRTIDVRIVPGPRASPVASKRPGMAHRVGVPLRRALSELRDNMLMGHPALLGAATRIATRLKVTGTDRREA
jgi:hypothetical protein